MARVVFRLARRHGGKSPDNEEGSRDAACSKDHYAVTYSIHTYMYNLSRVRPETAIFAPAEEMGRAVKYDLDSSYVARKNLEKSFRRRR